MAAIEPMHQFMIHKIIELPPVQTPIGMIDLSITNSVMTMIIAAGLICLWFLVTARGQLVPGRAQAMGEAVYGIVDQTLVGPIIGPAGKPYVPFVFTIFMLILFFNMIGLIFNLANVTGQYHSFTVTAQLAVTATLAILTFLSVIVIGFVRNGHRMYKLFIPSGMHWGMLLFMVPIELISFFVRPLTLAMRLFGNMIGGHVVMNIFASFIVGLGGFALATGGLAYLGLLGSAVSFGMVLALTALEFIVAFLQAFVFATLATVYLNEVVNLGHGH
jgi:F-type H+-transporting ATPase subunit a